MPTVRGGAVARPSTGQGASRNVIAPRPAPPWATHGEVDCRRKPVNLQHCVHFRGTESLASMHFIDQEQAANARLSQRLPATDRTRPMPTLEEERFLAPRTVQRSLSWRSKVDMPSKADDTMRGSSSGKAQCILRPTSPTSHVSHSSHASHASRPKRAAEKGSSPAIQAPRSTTPSRRPSSAANADYAFHHVAKAKSDRTYVRTSHDL
ncbi:unnamed protein product, partial [Effrenium voratum]